MNATLELIITVLELMDKYGIPEVIDILKTWNIRGNIRVEDIQKLKESIKKPSDFFEDKGEE